MNQSTTAVKSDLPLPAAFISALFPRDLATRRVLLALHYSILFLGIGAMIALATLFFNPDLADHVKEISPYAEESLGSVDEASESVAAAMIVTTPMAVATPLGQATSALTNDLTRVMHADRKAPVDRQQQAVSTWLSKRYRVAGDATQMLVSSAFNTARDIKLDPLLILAVMAIESGLNPFAESPVGAQGLMQVMSKLHREKFQPLGGVQAALNPAANIRVGSLILKDYVNRGGSVEAGLKLYVGAAAFDTDFGYGSKVLAEYQRLKDVAMGKNVPVFVTAAKAAPAPAKLRTPDATAAEPVKLLEPSAVEAEANRKELFELNTQQSKMTAEATAG